MARIFKNITKLTEADINKFLDDNSDLMDDLKEIEDFEKLVLKNQANFGNFNNGVLIFDEEE